MMGVDEKMPVGEFVAKLLALEGYAEYPENEARRADSELEGRISRRMGRWRVLRPGRDFALGGSCITQRGSSWSVPRKK